MEKKKKYFDGYRIDVTQISMSLYPKYTSQKGAFTVEQRTSTTK